MHNIVRHDDMHKNMQNNIQKICKNVENRSNMQNMQYNMQYIYKKICSICKKNMQYMQKISSANWGQIPYYQFYPPIIGDYCLLLAIIAIIVLRKVLLLLAILAPCSNFNFIAIIAKLLLQLIVSASNYLHYLQLFALFVIIGINLN